MSSFLFVKNSFVGVPVAWWQRWMRKSKVVPPALDYGFKVRVGFSNSERSWEEEVDLLSVMRDVLSASHHNAVVYDDHLTIEPGIIVTPRLAEFQPRHPRGARTMTTISVRYGDVIPDGVFEYQHAIADSLAESIRNGF